MSNLCVWISACQLSQLPWTYLTLMKRRALLVTVHSLHQARERAQAFQKQYMEEIKRRDKALQEEYKAEMAALMDVLLTPLGPRAHSTSVTRAYLF